MSDTTAARGSPHVLRLALLVCDTPAPHVVAKHGDYPYLFRRLFRRALNALSVKGVGDALLEIEITDFDVVHRQEFPSDDDLVAHKFDGIVITGSSYSAYQDLPWIKALIGFVREVYERHQGVRVVGVCFGHQIVSMACGGSCAKNHNGWEYGLTEMRLTDLGKKVFGANRTSLKLLEVHQDHVPMVPPDFDLLATTSPHTDVQSLLSRNGQILTVQGHPEFPAGLVDASMNLRLERGILTKEFVEEAKKRLWAEDVDDVCIGESFIKFFRGRFAE